MGLPATSSTALPNRSLHVESQVSEKWRNTDSKERGRVHVGGGDGSRQYGTADGVGNKVCMRACHLQDFGGGVHEHLDAI